MIPPWLVPVLVTAQVSAMSAGERIPMVAVALTPPGASTTFSVSDVRAALVRVVDQRTSLRVLPLDPSVDACAGSLACIVKSLTDAFTNEPVPPLFALVSQRPDLQVVAFVYDLRLAVDIAARGRAQGLTDDDIDAQIYDQGQVAQAAPTLLANAAALDAHLAALVERAWAASRDLEARGTLVVRTSTAPLAVELDGRSIGVSTSTTIVISDVRPGPRRLGLSGAWVVPATADVLVEAGAHATLELPLESTRLGRFPHETVWPVVGLFGAGAAMIAVGTSRASDLTAACLTNTPSDCAATGGFARIAGEGQGNGPLAVPLGYSLLVAGVAYAVTRVAESDDLPWWVAPLVAVGAGTLTYAVSELTAVPTVD